MMVFSKRLNQLSFKIFNRGYGTCRHLKINTRFLDLLLCIIDDITCEHCTVGQEDDIIIFIEQGGFSDVDIQDLSTVFSDLDIIINRDLFAEADDDTTDNVGKKVF